MCFVPLGAVRFALAHHQQRKGRTEWNLRSHDVTRTAATFALARLEPNIWYCKKRPPTLGCNVNARSEQIFPCISRTLSPLPRPRIPREEAPERVLLLSASSRSRGRPLTLRPGLRVLWKPKQGSLRFPGCASPVAPKPHPCRHSTRPSRPPPRPLCAPRRTSRPAAAARGLCRPACPA